MPNNETFTNSQYTDRQIRSAFIPQTNIHLVQQTEIIPPLPLNMDIPQVSSEQKETVSSEIPQQQTMRCDAPSFTPSTNLNEIKSENSTKNLLIYDLKKYKHDYFISNLSCGFDSDLARFSSPSGICTLNDDRLVVTNFGLDSLLLLDIQGTVYQIYRDILSPKDVLYYSTNPSQAVVATRKEVVILDLETKQVVVRSKLRGFYPWNIQYVKEEGVFAACDPSGERIVYFDKNLIQVGGWSFNEQAPGQIQGYQKVYPYAAWFFPDNTSLVLTHRGNRCLLEERDSVTTVLKKCYSTPPSLQSYSIYADNEKNCLIADKVNHCLVSTNQNGTFEIYKSKSIQEPYSMTFLSTGTLCITDWNKSFGTNGGIVVLSEADLKTNQ